MPAADRYRAYLAVALGQVKVIIGTQRCGAMRATMLGTSEPVTATITGVLFAGAVFTPTDLVGFAMIIIEIVAATIG